MDGGLRSRGWNMVVIRPVSVLLSAGRLGGGDYRCAGLMDDAWYWKALGVGNGSSRSKCVCGRELI